MKITNKLNLPQPIVDAVTADKYHPGAADISVTSLIDAPLISKLRNKHKGEMTEDASDRIYALMGKTIHDILEKTDIDAITEKRLYTTIDNYKISGQFDRLVLSSNTLQDYKMSSVWEYIHGLKESRIQQLNVYAFLLGHNGYMVDKTQIVMIFRDWMKSKARYDKNYPQQQVAIINVPLWSVSRQLEYIKKRIAVHTAEPCECTEEEKWSKPTTYAVKKEKMKKASRVLSTKEEAEKYILNLKEEEQKKCTIETRQGEDTRCLYYCSVSNFCSYQIKE